MVLDSSKLEEPPLSNAHGARKNYAAGRLYGRGSGGADTIVHLHPALWQLYARAS